MLRGDGSGTSKWGGGPGRARSPDRVMCRVPGVVAHDGRFGREAA